MILPPNIARFVQCVSIFSLPQEGFELTFRFFAWFFESLFSSFETEGTADSGNKRNGVSHGLVPIQNERGRERERGERERGRNDLACDPNLMKVANLSITLFLLQAKDYSD